MSAPRPDHDLTKLNPIFREKVERALAACHEQSVDAMVSEAMRSNELQAAYFAAGTSHAQTVEHSWHGYGLAVDVVSAKRGWSVWPERHVISAPTYQLVGGDPRWYEAVRDAFKAAGCAWGGDWHSIFDAPHFQDGRVPASPTPEDVLSLRNGGPSAVWLRYQTPQTILTKSPP